MNSILSREPTLSSSPKKIVSFLIPAYFLFALAVAWGVPAGAAVPLFPFSALVVAIFLYIKSPIDYISFTCWMAFLTPVIRRMIDYNAGYLTFGPWVFASALVAFVSADRFFRDISKIFRDPLAAPFLLCASSVCYGLVVSLILKQDPSSIVNSFMTWFCPLSFSYFIYSNWRSYPEICKVLQETFLLGCLLMGAYGVFQYLVAPEWDKFWLIESNAVSFGIPEPLGIRVSSTMNSPQDFATVMFAAMLMSLTSRKVAFQVPALVLGIIAFLLSMARAAWLSFVVGWPILVLSLKPRLQLKIFAVVTVIALLAVPIVMSENFHDVIISRLQSLTSAEVDVSYNARIDGYNELFGLALAQVTGGGFGARIPNSTDFVPSDSALFPILFSFGWVGTLPYLFGLFLISVKLFLPTLPRVRDQNIDVCKAVVVGIIAQFGLNFMLIKNMGLCLWIFAGLGLSAHAFYGRYESNRQKHNADLKAYL